MTTEITIDPRLKAYGTDLDDDEEALLRAQLKRDGCLDRLRVWDHDGKLILLDGHNRYRICHELNIPLPEEVEVIDGIDTYEQAEEWLTDNQLARRNLMKKQAADYWLGKKLEIEQRKESERRSSGEHQNDAQGGKVAAKVGEKYGKGQATIERDKDYAADVDKIESVAPGMKKSILNEKVKGTKAQIKKLASDPKKIKDVAEKAKSGEKVKLAEAVEDEKPKEAAVFDPDVMTAGERAIMAIHAAQPVRVKVLKQGITEKVFRWETKCHESGFEATPEEARSSLIVHCMICKKGQGFKAPYLPDWKDGCWRIEKQPEKPLLEGELEERTPDGLIFKQGVVTRLESGDFRATTVCDEIPPVYFTTKTEAEGKKRVIEKCDGCKVENRRYCWKGLEIYKPEHTPAPVPPKITTGKPEKPEESKEPDKTPEVPPKKPEIAAEKLLEVSRYIRDEIKADNNKAQRTTKFVAEKFKEDQRNLTKALTKLYGCAPSSSSGKESFKYWSKGVLPKVEIAITKLEATKAAPPTSGEKAVV